MACKVLGVQVRLKTPEQETACNVLDVQVRLETPG